jgi:hypothetical protein
MPAPVRIVRVFHEGLQVEDPVLLVRRRRSDISVGARSSLHDRVRAGASVAGAARRGTPGTQPGSATNTH